jgi:hypothetical protein
MECNADSMTFRCLLLKKSQLKVSVFSFPNRIFFSHFQYVLLLAVYFVHIVRTVASVLYVLNNLVVRTTKGVCFFL